MCGQVGMTLLCMHKVFSHWKREADDHDVILVTSKKSVYVEGREYIRGSPHKLKAIVWVFGSQTFW